MGMDVIGRNPKSEKGEYFRNNVWWWRPLWTYCEKVSPEAAAVENGQTNDGDGLDADDAEALAERLLVEIEAGRTRRYAANYRARLRRIPDEKCMHCDGTGERHDQYVEGTCNGCNGKGKVRPHATHYPFSVENVREFAEFCQDSGGFQIY